MNAREWLRSVWDDRPILIRASYVRDLEVDLQIAGWEAAERRRFDRTRTALASLWHHRPRLTTALRFDELERALAETAEQAAKIYEAGFAAGSGNTGATPPTPSRPRGSGHAARVTPTGRPLVAVGP